MPLVVVLALCVELDREGCVTAADRALAGDLLAQSARARSCIYGITTGVMIIITAFTFVSIAINDSSSGSCALLVALDSLHPSIRRIQCAVYVGRLMRACCSELCRLVRVSQWSSCQRHAAVAVDVRHGPWLSAQHAPASHGVNTYM